jgi:hypothetical protein
LSQNWKMTELGRVVKRVFRDSAAVEVLVIIDHHRALPELDLPGIPVSYVATMNNMAWVRALHPNVIPFETMHLTRPSLLLCFSVEKIRKPQLHGRPLAEHVVALSLMQHVSALVVLCDGKYLTCLEVGQVKAFALAHREVALVKTSPGLTIIPRKAPSASDRGAEAPPEPAEEYDPANASIDSLTVPLQPVGGDALRSCSEPLVKLGNLNDLPRSPALATYGRGLVQAYLISTHGIDAMQYHMTIDRVVQRLGGAFWDDPDTTVPILLRPLPTPQALLLHGYHTLGCIGYALRATVFFASGVINRELERLLPILTDPNILCTAPSFRAILHAFQDACLCMPYAGLRGRIAVLGTLERTNTTYTARGGLPDVVHRVLQRLAPDMPPPAPFELAVTGETPELAEEALATAISERLDLLHRGPVWLVMMEMQTFVGHAAQLGELTRAGFAIPGHLAYGARRWRGGDGWDILSRSLTSSQVVIAGPAITPTELLASGR